MYSYIDIMFFTYFRIFSIIFKNHGCVLRAVIFVESYPVER